MQNYTTAVLPFKQNVLHSKQLHCLCSAGCLDRVLTPLLAMYAAPLTTVSVNISGISPAPMPLYPGSDEPLLYPVVRFSSELNRTGDFHWPPSDVKTSMEHWIIAANTSTAFMWTPEDHLYEGWYNVHVSAISLHWRNTAKPLLNG